MPTSIMAQQVAKNHLTKIIGISRSSSLTSRTTKSTRITKSLIRTRTSSVMPFGYRTDPSAKRIEIHIGVNGGIIKRSQKNNGITFIEALMLASALSDR